MYELLSKIPLEITLRVSIVGEPREPPGVNEKSASSAAYTGIKGDLRHLPGREDRLIACQWGHPGSPRASHPRGALTRRGSRNNHSDSAPYAYLALIQTRFPEFMLPSVS